MTTKNLVTTVQFETQIVQRPGVCSNPDHTLEFCKNNLPEAETVGEYGVYEIDVHTLTAGNFMFLMVYALRAKKCYHIGNVYPYMGAFNAESIEFGAGVAITPLDGANLIIKRTERWFAENVGELKRENKSRTN